MVIIVTYSIIYLTLRLCIAQWILYLIGCIVFAAKFDKYWINTATEDWTLGYSFALSIVALVLEIIGAVLMIVEGKGGGGGSTKPSA